MKLEIKSGTGKCLGGLKFGVSYVIQWALEGKS